MIINTQNLFFLFVFLIVGIILIISFVYCCIYLPTFSNTHRQIIQDESIIDEERSINRAHLQNTKSHNQQKRTEIRNKYQLR